jgi:TetR/AcrR family transcriptional repressor of nem operon
MRRSREDTAETRRKIVDAASRLFRKNGIASTSIADVMGAIGHTVGGFYRHFEDKDQLVAESITHAASESVMTDLAGYLSKEHRAHREMGCPVSALCSEMSRERASPRHAFTDAVDGMIAIIAKERRDRPGQLAALATAVGALVLARAVTDPKLSDEILSAARAELARK